MSFLIAVAAASERAAVEAGLARARGPGGFEVIQTGVGKVNAASAVTARVLRGVLQPASKVDIVISLGIAGALPQVERAGEIGGEVVEVGTGPLGLGETVIGESSVYADEGVALPAGVSVAGSSQGFVDIGKLGFPPLEGVSEAGGLGFAADAELLARVRAVLPWARVGRIATVSTCSGTDELARAVATRTGAAAEVMEGAAIAHALRKLEVEGCEGVGHLRTEFVEVRVISNTTGNRDRQVWEMKRALGEVKRAAEALTGLARR
jgi:futalosine hydrolase